MNAGKSTALLHAAHNDEARGMKVRLFTAWPTRPTCPRFAMTCGGTSAGTLSLALLTLADDLDEMHHLCLRAQGQHESAGRRPGSARAGNRAGGDWRQRTLPRGLPVVLLQRA
jgi:hypothetical protein